MDWTKGVSDPVELEKSILSDKDAVIIKRLRQILSNKITNLRRREINTQTYDNPAWPYGQAHVNGLCSAYNDILRLLDFDQQ